MGWLDPGGQQSIFIPAHVSLAELVPQTTGGSGFRLDAVKHIDHEFLLKFVRFHSHYVDCLYGLYPPDTDSPGTRGTTEDVFRRRVLVWRVGERSCSRQYGSEI